MNVFPSSVTTNFRIATVAVAIHFIAGAGSARESDDCVPAPDFDIVTIDNSRISIAELTGHKPLYLKFWLSTCPQCIAETPHFVYSYEQYDDDIEFVAVNLAINETMPTLKRALSDDGLTLPVVYDEGGEM